MTQNPLTDKEIHQAFFACDLQECKGACCTKPGPRGAPLLDEEVEELERAYPVIQKYLSYRHKDAIAMRGMVQGRSGDLTTQVVDQEACVFVVFENGIAKCAIEKGFLNNELSWRKPISCHLFPIRVSPGETSRLRLESIPACQPAVENGRKSGIPVWEFLRPALVRAFGEAWYKEKSLSRGNDE
jgi:hypothetical protein